MHRFNSRSAEGVLATCLRPQRQHDMHPLQRHDCSQLAGSTIASDAMMTLAERGARPLTASIRTLASMAISRRAVAKTSAIVGALMMARARMETS
jgi:hypothetical protein